MSFGRRLRAARLAAGLSAIKMARLLGCTRVQVHRVEASQSVTEATVRRWAKVLELRAGLELS